MIEILSNSQLKILKYLAMFKFLTTSQLIQLGVSNRKSNLSVMLKPLKDSRRALVGEMEFAFIPTKGRLENFYFLKAKGQKVLIENQVLQSNDIKYPRGRSVVFTQDYFHRKYTIDAHIACLQDCLANDLQLIFFDRYFDKIGNNRVQKNLQAKTRMELYGEYIIPDGALLIKSDSQSRLFALELYNDKNVKRISAQIEKHISGIKESALCRTYNIEKGHRLLAIFTDNKTKESVKECFIDSTFKDYLLFRTYYDGMDHFLSGWETLTGLKTKLI